MTVTTAPKAKVLGRDPAVFAAQLNSLVIGLVLLLSLPDVWQAAVAGVTTAGTAVYVAVAVAKDGQVAALLGLGRAAIVVVVLAGVNWSEQYQFLVLAALEQILGVVIRDRVDRPRSAGPVSGDNVSGLA